MTDFLCGELRDNDIYRYVGFYNTDLSL